MFAYNWDRTLAYIYLLSILHACKLILMALFGYRGVIEFIRWIVRSR